MFNRSVCRLLRSRYGLWPAGIARAEIVPTPVFRQRGPAARRQVAGVGQDRQAGKSHGQLRRTKVSAEPADGKWQVELAPLPANDKPQTLIDPARR